MVSQKLQQYQCLCCCAPATGFQAPKHLLIIDLGLDKGLEAQFLLHVQFKEGMLLNLLDTSKGFDYLRERQGLHDGISSYLPGFVTHFFFLHGSEKKVHAPLS